MAQDVHAKKLALSFCYDVNPRNTFDLQRTGISKLLEGLFDLNHSGQVPKELMDTIRTAVTTAAAAAAAVPPSPNDAAIAAGRPEYGRDRDDDISFDFSDDFVSSSSDESSFSERKRENKTEKQAAQKTTAAARS